MPAPITCIRCRRESRSATPYRTQLQWGLIDVYVAIKIPRGNLCEPCIRELIRVMVKAAQEDWLKAAAESPAELSIHHPKD